jgi:hypothetical protein
MQIRTKILPILLSVLVILIVACSIVFAKMPRQREVVYYNTAPDYDKNLLMLGVRMSKFGGMAIYMDSPSVLLTQSDALQLTDKQQQDMQAIVDRARQEAWALLTNVQAEQIGPLPSEPFVLEEMDKTVATCDSGQCAVEIPPEGLPADHTHNHDHHHEVHGEAQ